VLAANNVYMADQGSQTQADTSTKQTAQKTPASGAMAAIFAMLIAMQRMKKDM
jgi:hypothetical protein